MSWEKESDEEDSGIEFSFLNTTIQFESDNSVSTSSSDSSGDLPPLVFRSDSSDDDSSNDNSTDTEESSSTSSYSDEEMPSLFHRSNSYDSDSSDKDTIESEDTNEMPPLLHRSNLYDSDSSGEDTIESEKLIGRLSRKDENEGDTLLAVVSEGEEEAAPDEVPSNTVVELMKRSGALNEDWVLLDSQSKRNYFATHRCCRISVNAKKEKKNGAIVTVVLRILIKSEI